MRKNKSDYWRGWRSELLALLALQQLRTAGIITDFRKRDERGIDFYLDLPNGLEMPLQVKSSEGGKNVHLRKHSTIPCISVNHHQPESTVVKMLYNEIFGYIQTFRNDR